jgi:hypothetical protein
LFWIEVVKEMPTVLTFPKPRSFFNKFRPAAHHNKKYNKIRFSAALHINKGTSPPSSRELLILNKE